jgi:ATP-binding cassette subfamily B (MDR/TAP) protein 1
MTKEEILDSDSSGLHQLDSRVPESTHLKIDIEKAEIDSTTVPEESNVDTKDGSKKETKKKWWGKKKEKETKEKAPEEPKVTYLQLYRFATTWDWACVVYVPACLFILFDRCACVC